MVLILLIAFEPSLRLWSGGSAYRQSTGMEPWASWYRGNQTRYGTRSSAILLAIGLAVSRPIVQLSASASSHKR